MDKLSHMSINQVLEGVAMGNGRHQPDDGCFLASEYNVFDASEKISCFNSDTG